MKPILGHSFGRSWFKRLLYIPRTSFLLTTRLSENTILARFLFLFQERPWERPLGPLWIPLCVSVHKSTTWNQSIYEKFQWLLLADRSARIYLWSVTSGGIVCYPITATSRFWMCHTICLMVLCQAFLSLLPPTTSIKGRNLGAKLIHNYGFWLDVSFFSRVKTIVRFSDWLELICVWKFTT